MLRPVARDQLIAIVTARDEADRIQATIAAVREAFSGVRVVLAESGSRDATAALAERAGAEVVRTSSRRRGKGASATTAARAALSSPGASGATFLLCDGDLGISAGRLGPLVEAGEKGGRGPAGAGLARGVGGGVGFGGGFFPGGL